MKKLNNFSQFWLRDKSVDELLDIHEKRVKRGKDLIALAGYRMAISNFVYIMAGKHIPVSFSKNKESNSYTTGEEVVIGSNLTDKNFDLAVGIALHEGSHVLLTDLAVFDVLQYRGLQNYSKKRVDKIILKAKTKGHEQYEVTNHIHKILNYVEDRRVDKYVFTTSPGYKGYYHVLYKKYFYCNIINKALRSTKYRTEDWDSYIFRILGLHNRNRDLTALAGLKEISNLLDLKNISRLKSTEESLDLAFKIYDVILNSLPDKKLNTNEKEVGSSEDNPNQMGDIDGSSFDNENFDSEYENSDNEELDKEYKNSDNGANKELKPLTENEEKQLKNALKRLDKFLSGNVQKPGLSKKDFDSIRAIEESGCLQKEVKFKDAYNDLKSIKCLVVKNLTKKIIDSNIFAVSRLWHGDRYDRDDSSNFVEEGLRLGTILGKKLKVRGETKTTKFTRKDSGKIDRRLLAELGFENENIFSQSIIEKYNKAYLHISIDASGSMSGTKWNKAMTSTVAMIKACNMAGNIEVVVTLRATHYSYGRAATNTPLLVVIYDSRKDNLTKVNRLFKYLDCSGSTPEGLCYASISDDLIPGTNNQESYFINFSDGMPIFTAGSNYDEYVSYRLDVAYDHTRKQIDNMKMLGIKVISYFIEGRRKDGENNESFKKMYGKDSHFIDPTNIIDVAKTMNKKFLMK
jgi:hypothetical protein